jgi:D-sedoheptulose 7-phosphate isomerase
VHNSKEELLNNYLESLSNKLKELDDSAILSFSEILNSKRVSGNTVFSAGNGGSASTASHLATDIGIGGLNRTQPIKAMSLCDNSAVITASANDNGYDSIFKNQLTTLASPGDLLVVITASGNSMNLIRAIEACESLGVEVFSLTGFDGGKVREMTLGRNIHIETPLGSYGIVEDLHLSICHMVTECLRAG